VAVSWLWGSALPVRCNAEATVSCAAPLCVPFSSCACGTGRGGARGHLVRCCGRFPVCVNGHGVCLRTRGAMAPLCVVVCVCVSVCVSVCVWACMCVCTTRADPNLYNCGKVCLSLLGTWAGEGWAPDKSTLTQVLISIQGCVRGPPPFPTLGILCRGGTVARPPVCSVHVPVVVQAALCDAVRGSVRCPTPPHDSLIFVKFPFFNEVRITTSRSWYRRDCCGCCLPLMPSCWWPALSLPEPPPAVVCRAMGPFP
jgi:hypothetical protein